MKIKSIISLVIIAALFALVLCVNAEDERPLPNRVHRVLIPRDLKPIGNGAPTNFFYVTITEPGHYRFILNRKRTFQVINSFPFNIDFFEMSRGDKWNFTLPRNYWPYSILFIEVTPHK